MNHAPDEPFAPPTAEEVIDLIEYSKRNHLRKAERNILKGLSMHRDALARDKAALTEQVNQLAAHTDRLEAALQETDASLRAARAEVDRMKWEQGQC